jgi:hypothetical protein
MYAVNTNGPGNIFDCLLTHIVEFETEFVLYLVVHDARNHNTAGIGQGFQPRRYINAVTVNVVTINYNVANIYTDAKLDTSLGR